MFIRDSNQGESELKIGVSLKVFSARQRVGVSVPNVFGRISVCDRKWVQRGQLRGDDLSGSASGRSP